MAAKTPSQPVQIVENPGHYEEPEEGQMVEVTDLALVSSAEIDVQIATARKYPRSLKAFRDQITELATLDADVARSCIYALPRDGKIVEGPSARFAEILVSCWGNNRSGGRVVAVDDEFVTGQGFFFDLEKNTAITYEVKRRITNRKGERFNADMIMTTGNAATSIAHRNASLKGIPKALWSYALDRAKAVVAGTQETLTARRVKMIKELNLCGATKEQIFGLVGVKGVDDITTDHMVILGGVYTAIKEGDLKVEDAFAVERMRAPGEMVPPRPRTSDFDRKVEEEKPAATKTSTKKATPASKAKTAEKVTIAAKGEMQAPQSKGNDFERTSPKDGPTGKLVKDQITGHAKVEGEMRQTETVEEGPQSKEWIAAERMVDDLQLQIEQGAIDDLDDFKKAGRINIDTIDGIADEQRDVLRGRFATIILTEQQRRAKRSGTKR